MPRTDAGQIVKIAKIEKSSTEFLDSDTDTSGYSVKRLKHMPMAKTVACGSARTAAVLQNGNVAMFGYYSSTFDGYPCTVQVNNTPNVRCGSVSCENQHTKVVTNDGEVYGYGPDAFDRVLYEPFFQPKAVSVSCGNEHTAVLLDDGVLRMTGSNSCGQLGVYEYDNPYAGLRTQGSPWRAQRFAEVSCGGFFTAALSRTGRLCTFGSNTHGQCGQSTTLPSREPGWVLLQPVFDVACGENHMACVAGNDRQLFTCGEPYKGQLGHGGTDNNYHPVTEPHPVDYDWQGGAIEQITCGEYSTAVVTNQGKIFQTGKFEPQGILWTFAPKVIRNEVVRTIHLEVKVGQHVMAVHDSQVSTMLEDEAFDSVVREIAAEVQVVSADTGHYLADSSGPVPHVDLRW